MLNVSLAELMQAARRDNRGGRRGGASQPVRRAPARTGLRRASAEDRGGAGLHLALPDNPLVAVAQVLHAVLAVGRVVGKEPDDRVGPAPAGPIELAGLELDALPDGEPVQRQGVS